MSLKKINIAIVGATGYVGLDLVLLLSKHSRVRIKYLSAKKNVGKSINFYDKRITKKLPVICDFKKINWHQVDLLFLSLPRDVAFQNSYTASGTTKGSCCHPRVSRVFEISSSPNGAP